MKAVILAAGEGRRLRPLTYTRPKHMISLAGKPILQHVIESLRGAGIRDIVIIVGYMKEKITGYFGNGKRFGVKISYAEQGGEGYGTAAALACARKLVKGEFLAVAGDIITESSAFKKVLKAHKGGITIALKKVGDITRYGIATLKGSRVADFQEKPLHSASNLANASIYVFDETVFDCIKKLSNSIRGEIELTDVIKNEIPKGKVSGIVIKEFWLDMGMPWHLFDANEYLLSKMKRRIGGKVEDSKITGSVVIEKGAHVVNSVIEGPAYIGENTKIGPFAYVRKYSSIGNNCDIGASTTVKNSIIMDGVNAKHLSYIGDSVVGENCNFGAGTQIANFRFDEGRISTDVDGRIMETTRRKFGAMIGDSTKTGVLSCIMPGRTIGDDCWIGASAMITHSMPRKTKIFAKQTLEIETEEQK